MILPRAKAIFDFSKNNENLKIVGGAIGNKELSVDEIKTLASLPSLDELRAKIVGLISSPLSNIVRIISEPQSSLTRLINKNPEQNNNITLIRRNNGQFGKNSRRLIEFISA